MNNLEIRKELVLSTSHIPQDLAEAMDRDTAPFLFSPVDSGYRVYTLDESELYPPEIKPAINLAVLNDCKWVLFDNDGPVVERLQTWEW